MRSDSYLWYRQTCVIAATCLLVIILDYFIVPLISFPISFLLPLSIMAWCYSLHATIVLAFVMMILRIASEIRWIAVTADPIPYMLMNNIINLVVINVIIYLIARVAKQQHLLRWHPFLPKLIPICAYCKKIRRTDGQWEEVEVYITGQTESTFSHGICPECTEVQREILRQMKRQ